MAEGLRTRVRFPPPPPLKQNGVCPSKAHPVLFFGRRVSMEHTLGLRAARKRCRTPRSGRPSRAGNHDYPLHGLAWLEIRPDRVNGSYSMGASNTPVTRSESAPPALPARRACPCITPSCPDGGQARKPDTFRCNICHLAAGHAAQGECISENYQFLIYIKSNRRARAHHPSWPSNESE